MCIELHRSRSDKSLSKPYRISLPFSPSCPTPFGRRGNAYKKNIIMAEEIFESLDDEFWEELGEEWAKSTLAEKRKEWGALGGRPPAVGEPRVVRKTIRYTPSEWFEVERRAKIFELTPSEYVRRCSLHKRMPDPERNVTLTKSAVNFKRLSNALRMGIFNDVERGRFLDELEEVIALIKKELKYGNESQIS